MRIPKTALAALCAVVGLAACGGKNKTPSTTSELVRGSTYYPLSPKPITILTEHDAVANSKDLLDALPNETIRLSVGTIDETGSLTFGAGSVGQEGHSYEVIVDYVKYTTAYLPVCFTSLEESDKGRYLAGESAVAFKTALGQVKFSNNTHVGATPEPMRSSQLSVTQKVPIYLGVGLRIRASIQVLKGNVQLSLWGIGSAASAGNVSGTMVVQTLGIFGEPVSTLIPLPSDVTQSSIQAAMQSLAAIKAKLYNKDVGARPQVVGFETIFGSRPAIQLIEATIEGTTIDAALVANELRGKPIDVAADFCASTSEPVVPPAQPGRK